MKDFFTFLRLILAFFRIRRKVRTVPGFLESEILIKPGRTLIFFSLWSNSKAFGHFNTAVPEHARLITQLYIAGVETWSGAFELLTKSATSEPWNKIPLTSQPKVISPLDLML